MKKVLFLAFLFFAAITSITAQEFRARTPDGRPGTERRGNPEARINRQLDELTEGLKLTAEQVVEVKAILTKAQERRAALRGQERGENREAMREQMQAINKETDAAIEALLTKKQLRRYENVKKQRQERRREGPGRRGPGRS